MNWEPKLKIEDWKIEDLLFRMTVGFFTKFDLVFVPFFGKIYSPTPWYIVWKKKM